MRTVRAELDKLVSLPAVWAACFVGVVVPAVIAVLNGVRGPDSGFQELAFGAVGAVVLGVVAASSEYVVEGETMGRQITTSLTVVPSRTRLLSAKIAAVVVAVTVQASVAAVVTFVSGQVPFSARVFGLVLYWVFTALLAFGATMLLRNGIVPLTVLVLNTSVVTVSFLLTKVTTAAVYLPDMAGIRMFAADVDLPVRLSPVAGGLVMAGWVVALLVSVFVVFGRRDA